MEKTGFLPLIYNASLLMSLILIYTLTPQISKKLLNPHKSIILGFYLGLIGVFVMLTPWQLSPGYLFDTRSILLALSGLYFGLIPTLIAMLMTAVMRLIDGGGGVVVGTILVFTSGFIGVIWRKARHISLENISFRELLLLGLIVHVVMLALMLFLPSVKMTLEVLSNIALPVLLVFPIVLALLGTFLSKILRDQFVLDERLKNEFLFQSQFYLGNIGMAITSPDQSWLRVNPRLIEMLGYSEEELQNLTWVDLTHPCDLDNDLVKFSEMMSGERDSYELDKRFLNKDGSVIYTHLTASCYQNKGEIGFIIATLLDITESKQAEEKLKLSASVFTHAREGITITDAEGIILDVNDTFSTTTGYSREEVVGQNPSMLQSGRQSPEFYADMWKALLNEGYWNGEIWNRRKNGEVYAEMKTISAVRDEQGVTTNYVALCTDITPIKEHQKQLEHIAHYDGLTNLPNRSLLADRLSQAMLQCSRHEQSLAVVFLDLDGFKEVNDVHGHDIGDELLIALSHRMKEALREGDTLSRIGGDEFVAVLVDLVKVEDCKPVLERLLLATSKPITVKNITLNVSASIGITLYPQDSVDADQLMRHADQTMYMAKQAGKNQYKFFDTKQEHDTINKNDRLTEIQQALINNEFQLYYQPKVNMVTGKVFGVEALVRWNHPEQGLVPPLDFLPLIDGTDLEIQLGEWVTNQAMTQLELLRKQDCQLEVSINISCHHLLSNAFIAQLDKALAKYPAVDAQLLQLEILESSVLSDINAVTQVINNCQSTLGVSFALDDFGTGYSSLTHLRNLPAGTVKIDQSFIKDILDDPNDYAIIDGVIRLADSFNRDVIAEGVETTNHGLMLLLMGCEQAQGYGIAKPMPVDQLTNWLSNYLPNPEWQLCGSKLRSKKEKERELFRLTTARWGNKFVTKILSEPKDSDDWPLLDATQCPCGSWLKRAKRAQLFDGKGLELIQQAHKKVHLIANALFIKYQEGKLDEARNGLVELQVIFDDMNTVLDLCD